MNSKTMMDAARSLAPALRERARQTELDRNVSETTIKELKEAGLFKILQPKRYGGFELPPSVFYDATMEIAAACGSTGWVFGVVGVHNWQLGLFPEEAQEEVWGEDPQTLTSSSYAPTGRIERVDGGFKLSGTWNFSSGCGHCQWAILGGIILEDGLLNHYSFLVPRTDYEIDDVWHVVGLAGTGSNNVRLDDVFVPDHRAQPTMLDLEASGRGSGLSPLYRLPFASVFSNAITSSAIGIGMGSIEAFTGHIKGRFKVSSGVQASGDVHVQIRLAEAASEIDAARLQLDRNMSELLELAEKGLEIPMELRVRVRRDQVRGTQAAIRATDRVFESAGGKALYLDQPIQRFWRDVHAARVHAINELERGLSLYGSHELGAELPPGNMV